MTIVHFSIKLVTVSELLSTLSPLWVSSKHHATRRTHVLHNRRLEESRNTSPHAAPPPHRWPPCSGPPLPSFHQWRVAGGLNGARAAPTYAPRRHHRRFLPSRRPLSATPLSSRRLSEDPTPKHCLAQPLWIPNSCAIVLATSKPLSHRCADFACGDSALDVHGVRCGHGIARPVGSSSWATCLVHVIALACQLIADRGGHGLNANTIHTFSFSRNHLSI
jgi:hypothetical protein